MFGLTAATQWMKSRLGYRYILALLVVTLFVTAWSGKVLGQSDIFFGNDKTIRRITFEQPPFNNSVTGVDDYGGGPFTANDVAAITRVVNYLNDLVSVPYQGWSDLGEWHNGWNDYTIEFRHRDEPHMPSSAYAHAGPGHGVCVESGASAGATAASQLTYGSYFENSMLHELGHVLGIGTIGGADYTIAAGKVTFTRLGSRWGQFRAPDGSAIVLGRVYDLEGVTNPFLFYGNNAVRVFGDVWAGGSAKGVAVDSDPGSIGTFAHPWDPPGGVMTYRSSWTKRAFYSEVELAILRDLGNTVDISRFFGRSLNQIHSGIIDNYTGFNGDGIFGVGLHFVISDTQTSWTSPGNTVVQHADLISRGLNGAGIRIEGYNHTVTIAEGVTVAATGENGIGIVMADSNVCRGSTIENYGTIYARNEDVNSVDYDSLGYAIHVNNTTNNVVKLYGDSQVIGHIGGSGGSIALNFLEGITHIEGDVNVSSVNFNPSATLSDVGGLVMSGTFTGNLVIPQYGTLGAWDTDNLVITGNLTMDGGSTLLFAPVSDKHIDVTGTVTQSGMAGEIAIQFSDWEAGTFTLLTATGGGIDGTKYAIDKSSFGNRKDADIDGSTTPTELIVNLSAISNLSLTWTGGTDGNWDTTTADNWTDGSYSETFYNGDSVLFASGPIITGITVGSSGVSVGTMTVTDADYTFSLAVGTSPAITSTGTIDLGNATLNITGYTPDESNPYNSSRNIQTVIQAGGTLSNFNSAVTVLNQASVDFLAASAFQDGDDIKVETRLTWDSTDPDRKAHGSFTINTGTFTLGVGLTDNSASTNRATGWDGDSLTKQGAGTLILTADNTYTGGTTVAAGTLQIGNGGTTGSVAGDIATANSTYVAFNRSDDVTFSGTISGAGSLIKQEAGTLTLTGNNTYTGGTVVEAGTLQIGNGTPDGSVAGNIDIASGANVTFDRSDAVTFGGVISGGGSLTKNGSGTLTLSGVNTYTGTTTVESGTLFVGDAASPSARIAGIVDVRTGAILGGYGTIGGLIIVQGGATLSPGGSIGTLTAVNGITFESGSTYLYEIDAIDNSDLLVVSNGDVTITPGAMLDVVTPAGLRLLGGERFQVIDLEGSAAFAYGTLFESVGTWGGYYLHDLRWGDGYYLTWIIMPTDFANTIRAIGSPNAINAAEGVDELVQRRQVSNINRLYRTLGSMPDTDPQGLADAFAQLHGEVFASSKEAATQMQRRFQSLLPNGRDFYSLSALPKEWNRWGTFTGDYNNRKTLKKYSGYEAASAGFAFGADQAISPFGLCGVAIGYDYVDQNLRSIRSSAEIEACRAMLYGSWFNGEYYCDTYIGYTKNWYKTRRDINIGTFSDITKSRYNDDMGSMGVEVGRTCSLDWCLLTPSIGIHYNFIDSPTITEEGGEASLRVASSDYHSVRVPVGIKASKMFPWDHGSVWTPEIRAFYTRELANDTVKVRTAFAGEQDVNFVATSGVRGQNNVRLGLGVGLLAANRVNIRLDYDCDIYNNTTADTFAVTLGVSW